jgi:hypothetical protein
MPASEIPAAAAGLSGMPDAPRPAQPAAPALLPPGDAAAQLRPLRVLFHAFRAGDIAEPLADAAPGGMDPVLQSSALLIEVIRHLQKRDRVIVTGPDGATGQITRSDLQQLPGRTWLFGMVAAIEIYFTQRIQIRWAESEWTTLLSINRLTKAREIQAERARRGERCRLLDCLQLSDKAQLLINDRVELAALGYDSKNAARKAVGNLELLRNNLAHSQPVVDTYWTQIANLVLRIEQILVRNPPPPA